MTRPGKPVLPTDPPGTWGNVTLAFQDAGGREVAAYTIDAGQQFNGRRHRVPGDLPTDTIAVPETAVTFLLSWNLAPRG